MLAFDSEFDKNLHIQEAVLTESELNNLSISGKNIPANTFVFPEVKKEKIVYPHTKDFGVGVYSNPEDQNTDTITVTVDDILKERTIVIEVKKGKVILFKAKDQASFLQSRVSFKFWGVERQGSKTTYYLHSKGKIIFGKKKVNENIPVISPVTGKLEVKLRKHVWIAGVIGTGTFFIFAKVFFF